MQLVDLKNAKYIALETFRKTGEGVITPVWVAGANGKLYIWTGANSWKVKRIQKDKQVRLCESDARGNPKSGWVEAQATVLDKPQDEPALHKLMQSKYGFQYRMFRLMGRGSDRVFLEISSP
jgi:PPOX class probable F420-dependent enzyme